MQVLDLYYSRIGNTKKLAEETAKGVKQVEGVTCVSKSAAHKLGTRVATLVKKLEVVL